VAELLTNGGLTNQDQRFGTVGAELKPLELSMRDLTEEGEREKAQLRIEKIRASRGLFMPGNQIQLKNHRGKLRRVGTVTTEIEVSDQRIVCIPNRSLLESSVSVDGKEEWP